MDPDVVASTFGVWKYCAKTKKRYYVSINGKRYVDSDAFRQYMQDKRTDKSVFYKNRIEVFNLMNGIQCSYQYLDSIRVFEIFNSQASQMSNDKVTVADNSSLLSLTSWGFSSSLIRKYAKRGIFKLFPWQVECLLTTTTSSSTSSRASNDGGNLSPLSGANLLYSAPTSGGKTLIAEILMLRRLAWEHQEHLNMKHSMNTPSHHWNDASVSPRKVILFVVPFVSLAEEKTSYFQELWGSSGNDSCGLNIRAYHGEAQVVDDKTHRGGLAEDVDIAVCTIEKANVIMTQLVEAGDEYLNRISMVVIDELHMLADSHRGFLLEILLSKILYLRGASAVVNNDTDGSCPGVPSSLNVHINRCNSERGTIQIVGMSATLPNIRFVGEKWLNALVYITDYRPVKLASYLCVDRGLYAVTGNASSPVQIQLETTIEGKYPGLCIGYQKDFIPASVANTRKHKLYDGLDTSAHTGGSGSNNTLCVYDDRDGFLALCLEPQLSLYGYRSIASRVQTALASGSCTGNADTESSSIPTSLGGSNPRQCSKSVMVFCCSKLRCESSVERITDTIKRIIQSGQMLYYPYSYAKPKSLGEATSANAVEVEMGALLPTLQAIYEGRKRILHQLLTQTIVGLCPKLKKSIPFGVAYHHAGLTLDERKIIEQGFRDGYISILCTTSTLSAGVNLPTRRVIIRDPRMGHVNLSIATYRQMIGRAGRTNLDDIGEAFLMVQKPSVALDVDLLKGIPHNAERRPGNGAGQNCNVSELRWGVHLMTGEMAPLISSLHQGMGGGIEKLLLELICCGRIHTMREIDQFIDCTLMHTQHTLEEVARWKEIAIQFLLKHKFIVTNAPINTANEELDSGVGDVILDSGVFIPTAMGRATVLSGLSPKDSIELLCSLQQARVRYILKAGGFHAIYLSTPPSFQNITINWHIYEELIARLETNEKDIYEILLYLGVDRAELAHFLMHPPKAQEFAILNSRARFYRRVFSAILLYTVIQEKPLNYRVLREFGIEDNLGTGSSNTRGAIQQLQKEASTFCGMVVMFCKRLNWISLATIIEAYSKRLYYGVQEELLPLVRISTELLPGFRARALFNNGIKTPEDIIRVGPEVLCQLLVDTIPFESSAPLQRPTNRNFSSASSNTRLNQLSCEHLAEAIVMKTKELILQEASYTNSSKVQQQGNQGALQTKVKPVFHSSSSNGSETSSNPVVFEYV